MPAKTVLVRPQGLRPRARAPTCSPPPATPLLAVSNSDLKFRNLARLWLIKLNMSKSNFKKLVMTSF